MDSTTSETPLDRLVTQIVDLGGPLTAILEHMHGFPSHPEAEPVPVVLRQLLHGILEPMADRRPAGELELAAAVLDEVTEAIVREILLVPPPRRPNRHERRERRPRPGGRGG